MMMTPNERRRAGRRVGEVLLELGEIMEAPEQTDERQREIRDDVLRAVRFHVEHRTEVDWPGILGGVIEAVAVVQGAAITQPDDRAKAAALIRNTIEEV